MYRVKSLTGTALGSRNTLCFSVCYKRRKCKPSQGLQLARGSHVCWWQLTCEPGNSCTGTGQWHLSGLWWHQPSGSAGCYSAVTWFGFHTLPSGVICWFLSAYGWVDLCETPEDVTTFSFTAVGLCNSPTAIPHWEGCRDKCGVLLILHIPLHAHIHQEKYTEPLDWWVSRKQHWKHVLLALTFLQDLFPSLENLLRKQATHTQAAAWLKLWGANRIFDGSITVKSEL